MTPASKTSALIAASNCVKINLDLSGLSPKREPGEGLGAL